MTEETLFELALNTAAADRATLLDRECGGDPELRAHVLALVAAHERLNASSRAEQSPPGAPFEPPTVTAGHGAAEQIGTVVGGRYKLVESIGEGGMGSVFLAQQTEPVRRTVAVKVIKAGMDTRALLARFDAERQALALMDHPNIARVLDAGATDSGRPFFVMELVKGVPITKFCDERRLTPRQRLELFAPVCQAIQHAHQKGVIHRDIKPNNVLVALYDDRPVPKVIDFGVAKATGPQLTDHSLLTGFGAVVGTPEYMSPEQAGFNNLDIDTRSDVYALGVLLYELLTGTTPVSRKSLADGALLEILRIVREVEPPLPSTRLSSSDALPSVAASRGVEPEKLATLVRGELDWIVMKSLEKDRGRRYETANALARDIQRYLADEIVEARPPSAGYRLRKLLRRHRGQVAAASLLLLAMLAGVIGTTWGLVRAEHARRAEAARAKGEQQARLEADDERAKALAAAEAERIAKNAEIAANAQAQKRLKQIEKGNEILAGIFAELDIHKLKADAKPLEAVLAERLVKAAGQLEGNAVGDPLAVASLQFQLGQSLYTLGFAPQAIPLFEKALATRRTLLGLDDPSTLSIMNPLALAYGAADEREKSTATLEEALRLETARLGPNHDYTLATMNNLAARYRDAGQSARALPLFEETLRLTRAKFGPDHVGTLVTMGNLATAYLNAGRPAEAVSLNSELLGLMKKNLGPDHRHTLVAMRGLAESYVAAGEPAKALPMLEEALRLHTAKLDPTTPTRSDAWPPWPAPIRMAADRMRRSRCTRRRSDS